FRRAWGGEHIEVVVRTPHVRCCDGHDKKWEQHGEPKPVQNESDGGQAPAQNHEEDEQIRERRHRGLAADAEKLSDPNRRVNQEGQEEGPECQEVSRLCRSVGFLEARTEGGEELCREYRLRPACPLKSASANQDTCSKRRANQRAERQPRVAR